MQTDYTESDWQWARNNNPGHQITIMTRGEGITRELRPFCSCGWKGIGYEAHNDWQYSNIQEMIEGHLENALVI